jgi:hypothetical protein
MPTVVQSHLEAANGAQLRGFGWTTFANVGALPGTGRAGEIVYVTAEGRCYQWDSAEATWVRWSSGATSWKAPVVVASAAAVTLATPGATVDGVGLSVGDRFLALGQAAPAENGIYVYQGAAAAATRALDVNSGTEADGASVFVMGGTLADRQYQQTTNPVTIGTTAQTWTLVGPSTGVAAASDTVAGIVELLTDAEAVTGTDTTRAMTAANLRAVLNNRGGTALVGDGTVTTGTVAHGITGLAATDDLLIRATVEATGFDVDLDVSNDATNITWATVAAPAANAYRLTWFFVGA